MKDARTPDSRSPSEAITELVRHPRYELIPLVSVADQLEYLPRAATVTVTASPGQGTAATLDLAGRLAASGFRVIPHLAARQIADRSELSEILAATGEMGIAEVFVVGGDAEAAGEFFDGLALLSAMADIGHPFTSIGIPAYPEGHSSISNQALREALDDKAPYASSITTQMCFAATTIRDWLGDERGRGMQLPVYLGVPGAAPLSRLVRIAARIGVGDSARFLSSNVGLLGRLVRPGGYAPDGLLLALGDLLADPTTTVAGIHLFTFNQVETTEQWRIEFLDQLN